MSILHEKTWIYSFCQWCNTACHWCNTASCYTTDLLHQWQYFDIGRISQPMLSADYNKHDWWQRILLALSKKLFNPITDTEPRSYQANTNDPEILYTSCISIYINIFPNKKGTYGFWLNVWRLLDCLSPLLRKVCINKLICIPSWLIQNAVTPLTVFWWRSLFKATL